MRKTLVSFVVGPFLIMLVNNSACAQGWRGIVPLHSTRADVERLLGPPTESSGKFSVWYRSTDESVNIRYSEGLPCGIGQKYSQWRVAENTVVSVYVTLRPVPLSQLGIDTTKYKKKSGGHLPEDTYYAVGNRTSSHLNTGYTYQGFNKLASTNSATYSYDNNGRQSAKVDGSGTRTLAWDPENRLKQVTLPGGPSATYKYDALGRRIQRTTSARADERYVYDGDDVVVDLNSSSGVTTTYLNGPGIDDHLRQTNTTTGTSYFLTDHLGTTAALTDASGNVVETLAYDSFGNNAGSTRTRYTFTGRERDADTGLLYYRAPFYDPQLGRFISEDPIGFAGGDVNLYGYVWQNPLSFTDPSGLDGWTPGDLADKLDSLIERARRYLTGRNPDAVNTNTVIHYALNTYKGPVDLLRVGRGFGNYYYGTPCTAWPREQSGRIADWFGRLRCPTKLFERSSPNKLSRR